MTNFGKRAQMTPAPTARPPAAPFRSHMVVETMARTNAQMPIQMSRPMTFMSVKVWMAASVPVCDAMVWAAA